MATPFHEVRFPEDIAYGTSFGPEFSTDVVTMANGAEQRNINWNQARCKGNAVSGIKNQRQLNRLISFFRNRKGKAYGFRFKDWSDFTGEFECIGWGDGQQTEYQLVKNYEDIELNIADVRKIKKPVKDTIKIYFQTLTTPRHWAMQKTIRDTFTRAIPKGAEQIGNWNIDITTGKISFVTPPAENVAIIASFEFDVPVRFDTDTMPVNFETVEHYNWQDIPIIELKIL